MARQRKGLTLNPSSFIDRSKGGSAPRLGLGSLTGKGLMDLSMQSSDMAGMGSSHEGMKLKMGTKRALTLGKYQFALEDPKPSFTPGPWNAWGGKGPPKNKSINEMLEEPVGTTTGVDPGALSGFRTHLQKKGYDLNAPATDAFDLFGEFFNYANTFQEPPEKPPAPDPAAVSSPPKPTRAQSELSQWGQQWAVDSANAYGPNGPEPGGGLPIDFWTSKPPGTLERFQGASRAEKTFFLANGRFPDTTPVIPPVTPPVAPPTTPTMLTGAPRPNAGALLPPAALTSLGGPPASTPTRQPIAAAKPTSQRVGEQAWPLGLQNSGPLLTSGLAGALETSGLNLLTDKSPDLYTPQEEELFYNRAIKRLEDATNIAKQRVGEQAVSLGLQNSGPLLTSGAQFETELAAQKAELAARMAQDERNYREQQRLARTTLGMNIQGQLTGQGLQRETLYGGAEPVRFTEGDIQAAYGSKRGDSNYNPAFDLNGDGQIGYDDVVAMSSRSETMGNGLYQFRTGPLTEEARSARVKEALAARGITDQERNSAIERAVAQGNTTGQFVDPQTGLSYDTLQKQVIYGGTNAPIEFSRDDFSNAAGKRKGEAGYNPAFDVNKDGVIDLNDMNVIGGSSRDLGNGRFSYTPAGISTLAARTEAAQRGIQERAQALEEKKVAGGQSTTDPKTGKTTWQPTEQSREFDEGQRLEYDKLAQTATTQRAQIDLAWSQATGFTLNAPPGSIDQSTFMKAYDEYNKTGKVNLAADFNRDGKVDLEDLFAGNQKGMIVKDGTIMNTLDRDKFTAGQKNTARALDLDEAKFAAEERQFTQTIQQRWAEFKTATTGYLFDENGQVSQEVPTYEDRAVVTGGFDPNTGQGTVNGQRVRVEGDNVILESSGQILGKRIAGSNAFVSNDGTNLEFDPAQTTTQRVQSGTTHQPVSTEQRRQLDESIRQFNEKLKTEIEQFAARLNFDIRLADDAKHKAFLDRIASVINSIVKAVGK